MWPGLFLISYIECVTYRNFQSSRIEDFVCDGEGGFSLESPIIKWDENWFNKYHFTMFNTHSNNVLAKEKYLLVVWALHYYSQVQTAFCHLKYIFVVAPRRRSLSHLDANCSVFLIFIYLCFSDQCALYSFISLLIYINRKTSRIHDNVFFNN